MLVNLFIAMYLLFALFWDAPETNVVDRKLKAAVRATVIRLGLSHRWNMYAGPFTHIVELEARARYADGSIEAIPLPSRYEFRRYAFMLVRQRNDALYRGFADYLAARLPRESRGPLEILLVRRVAETPARNSWLGRFDRAQPSFRETIVAKRSVS